MLLLKSLIMMIHHRLLNADQLHFETGESLSGLPVYTMILIRKFRYFPRKQHLVLGW